MSGRVFGIRPSVEEIANERNPPSRKTWETASPPRLLVIGHYRMGFDITPQGNAPEFRVVIDYALPVLPRPVGSDSCSATTMPDDAPCRWPTL